MHLTKKGELVLTLIVGVTLTVALCAFLSISDFSCESEARAEEAEAPLLAPEDDDRDETGEVAVAIMTLQPAASFARAARLAEIFVNAGDESAIDPLILVAIAMRESSFSPAVEDLTRRGSRGELGLMQIHPRGPALAMRPEGCSDTLDTASCQVRTGARWLAHAFATCPGSTWRGVAYYGRSTCPSERAARADRNANIAASHYARIGGTRW